MSRCIPPGRTNYASDPERLSEAFAPILGGSPSIQELKRKLIRLAPTDVNVLITGETGTGKELVASAIHRGSKRNQRNFLCVNCAALPDALLESELFGHARGAFTGAVQSRIGKLRHCDGGSVFLDEIGELTLTAQAKLLRAIESREIQTLGGDANVTADFRLITATNQPLEKCMEAGTFRRDLYYRLNVAHLRLPPLRERPGDVPLLTLHYLSGFNCQFGLNVARISDEAMETLQAYAWPGNIRELRNVIESAFLSVEGDTLHVSDLPENLRPAIFRSYIAAGHSERERMIGVLREVNWNKSKAAGRLQWSRMTLYRKLAKYEVHDEEPLKQMRAAG